MKKEKLKVYKVIGKSNKKAIRLFRELNKKYGGITFYKIKRKGKKRYLEKSK